MHPVFPGEVFIQLLGIYLIRTLIEVHDDVMTLKHFPLYWLFVRGIQWLLVESRQKGRPTEHMT